MITNFGDDYLFLSGLGRPSEEDELSLRPKKEKKPALDIPSGPIPGMAYICLEYTDCYT